MKKIAKSLLLGATALVAVSCCQKEPEVKNIIFMIGDGMAWLRPRLLHLLTIGSL